MFNYASKSLFKALCAVIMLAFAFSATANESKKDAENKTASNDKVNVTDVKSVYNKEHKNMAVHFTLNNKGEKVNLVQVSVEPTTVATKVELHDNTMKHADKVEVNAGETKFDEKTHHVMLTDVSPEAASKNFSLNLKFDNNTNLKVEVTPAK